jgi:hypothetical protein
LIEKLTLKNLTGKNEKYIDAIKAA